MDRKQINLLILEDDYEAVASILLALRQVEAQLLPDQLVISVYTDYKSVENLLNPLSSNYFQVILLDRDCTLGGSFHVMDLEKFGLDKVISISSTPQWNREAQARGIKRVVPKTFEDIPGFAKKVAEEVRKVIFENYGLLEEFQSPTDSDLRLAEIGREKNSYRICYKCMNCRLEYGIFTNYMDRWKDKMPICPECGNDDFSTTLSTKSSPKQINQIVSGRNIL